MIAPKHEWHRATIEDRFDGDRGGGGIAGKVTGLHRHIAAIDDAHLAAGEKVRSEVVVVVAQERQHGGRIADAARQARAGWRGEALQVIRVTERHADDGDVGIERVEIIAPGRIEERRLAKGHRRDS